MIVSILAFLVDAMNEFSQNKAEDSTDSQTADSDQNKEETSELYDYNSAINTLKTIFPFQDTRNIENLRTNIRTLIYCTKMWCSEAIINNTQSHTSQPVEKNKNDTDYNSKIENNLKALSKFCRDRLTIICTDENCIFLIEFYLALRHQVNTDTKKSINDICEIVNGEIEKKKEERIKTINNDVTANNENKSITNPFYKALVTRELKIYNFMANLINKMHTPENKTIMETIVNSPKLMENAITSILQNDKSDQDVLKIVKQTIEKNKNTNTTQGTAFSQQSKGMNDVELVQNFLKTANDYCCWYYYGLYPIVKGEYHMVIEGFL